MHGHCHQKSFGAFKPVEKVLRLVPGLGVTTIESSCCGMAGAVRLRRGDLSRPRSRWPSCRCSRRCASADQDTLIVADGTSCRHQIKDGSGARRCMSPAYWR